MSASVRRSQLPSPHEPRGDKDKKEKKRSKDEKREKTPKSDKKQKKDKRDKREGKSSKTPALSIEDTGPEAAADASRSLREVADTTVHSSQARAYSPAKPPMHRGHTAGSAGSQCGSHCAIDHWMA